MRKVIWIVLGFLLLILVVFGMGVCVSLVGAKKGPLWGKEISIYKIEGMIVTSDDVVEDLEDLRKDSSVSAVVLRIDSPGGAVSASQEIFDEVKRLNADKPVVVSMGDVAASGGYYIACGARKIFANQGTITGSIGVRVEHVNLKDLLAWAKISHETLKSGEYKDMGSFDRPMKPEERKLWDGILSDMHRQFKKEVSLSRKIPLAKLEKIADGRIFSGSQALELGLVDELGGQSDAIKSAASLAGIVGEPKVTKVRPKKSRLMRFLFDDANSFFHKAGQTLAVYLM